METKKTKKVIDIDAAIKDITYVEKNEEASYKMACLRDKVFTNYPQWFEDIEVPDGTRCSVVPGVQAWMMLNRIRKEKRPNVHPSHVVDDIAMSHDIKFANAQLGYQTMTGENKIIPSVRGYFIANENVALTLCAAHVADILAYNTRCDKKGMISDIAEKEDMKNLRMMYYDVKAMRKTVDDTNCSETIARDEMFDTLFRQPEVAYSYCDLICRMYPEYGYENNDATQAAIEVLKEKGKEYRPKMIMVPKPGPIDVPRGNGDITRMYKTMLYSRGIRGEDKGVGSLTFGYIYGSMSRATVKAITHFLDIRQPCNLYEVDVIYISGVVSELVIRMLVRNNFFVVSSYNSSGERLTVKKYESKKYGLYSSLEEGILHGVYYSIESRPPELSGGDLIYHEVDVMAKFNISRAQDSVVFHCLGAHIGPNMKGKDFGFLPGALPHNGMVLCVYPPLKDISYDDMVDRIFVANLFRNNCLTTKRLFAVADRYSQDVGYFREFYYPKMRLRMKAKDFSILGDAERKDVDPLEDLELKMPQAITLKEEQRVGVDRVYVLLLQEMESFGQVDIFISTMVVNWNRATNFLAALVLAKQKVTIEEVCTELKKRAPLREKLIDQGYVMGMQARNEVCGVKQEKQVDDDPNDDMDLPKETRSNLDFNLTGDSLGNESW